MGVIRVKVRNYADIVQRINDALKKSDQLTVWHQASTSSSNKIIKNPSYQLYCLRYTSKNTGSPLIYVSAGIHGDEPAGIECAVRLIELLTDKDSTNQFPFPLTSYNWLISPCDNPFGYERNIRENGDGLDLNRMFETPNQSQETTFIAESLMRLQCQSLSVSQRKTNRIKYNVVDLALDLHEDSDSNGFYLWERRTTRCHPIGHQVVKNVEGICHINQKPLIEDHCNEGGVITLLDAVTTKGWTRGRYLAEQVNTRCLITETPSQFDWETRVEVHLKAVQIAINYHFI